MPSAFNFEASPFDCLDPDERKIVQDGVDIAYFPKDQVILDAGAAATHLYVLIKGFVRQEGAGETIASYGPDDSFDGRGLMAGKASSRFVATEEVLAYQLSRQAVNELIARNAEFGALLFADLSNKLGAIAGRQSRHELQSLTLARADQVGLRPPHFVDADTDVLSVVRLFQAQRTTSVIVRDMAAAPPRLGIFTATALQRAVLEGTPLDRLPVGAVANFGLVCVRASDPVGDALTVMVRHAVHRVVVTRDDDAMQIVGVLEALDLFSFLSNHSYLINREIAEASDLAGLRTAAGRIEPLIALLHRGGTRVGQIAALVQALNAKLFERAWQFIAPPALVANSCLIVMGSEGRGEQLLRTDQDNGLLLRDGYTPPSQLQALCESFSQALSDFGYPPCRGGVMLSNPAWRGSERDFTERARNWLMHPDGDALMSLAIFLDAHAVCGDAGLLEGVREQIFCAANDSDVRLARFAAAIDAFAGDENWWNRLWAPGPSLSGRFDPKKQGTFPIVHGVRSLALQCHLRETSTAARLDALVAAGQIDHDLATDVLESLQFFMRLKLQAGLLEIERGQSVSGSVDLARMSSLDRDLLKDTLEVVKRFRRQLRMRFRLDAL